MKKKAFTLAEVLIVLVIIGIVAGICVPVIFANYQEQDKAAKVKKAYSSMAKALTYLKVTGAIYALEDMALENNDIIMFNWFDNYMKPNLSTLKVCYESKGCWNTDETRFLNGGIINFEASRPEIGIGVGIVSVILNDGTFATFNLWSPGDTKRYAKINYDGVALRIAFDINGAKKPNTIGKDIFYMYYVPERGLTPPFADATNEEIKQDCSKNGMGLSCTIKYLNN